jgi:hypothetical protein
LKGTLAKTDINDIRNQGLVLREISSKTDTNIIRNPELVLGGTPTRTEKHMRGNLSYFKKMTGYW